MDIVDEVSAVNFAKKHCAQFTDCDNLRCTELSDGNINYVFRVEDEKSGNSVIIKQAAKSFRSSPNEPLTDERILFEIGALLKIDELCPGHAPKIYAFDNETKCAIMEDCKDYSIMRTQMMKFRSFSDFGKNIALLLARLHFYTGDFYLSGQEKKDLVKKYINPELCEITERLVFTETFTNYLKRNTLPKELVELVKTEIYEDVVLRQKAAELKYIFLTSAQALLHGDLHTGSIFINDKSFKVFDTEFAFVGPCSYDIGCIIGNLMFAYIAANVVGCHENFEKWALCEVIDILHVYKSEFLKLVKEKTKDTLLKQTLFCEKWLNNVLADSVATAGVEILRRTITAFKVSDITQLPLDMQNVSAQRLCVLTGKEMMLNSEKYTVDFGLVDEFVKGMTQNEQFA